MSERPIIRCYKCPNFRKRRGSEDKGRCEELKQNCRAVDWCYRDQVKALREEAKKDEAAKSDA